MSKNARGAEEYEIARRRQAYPPPAHLQPSLRFLVLRAAVRPPEYFPRLAYCALFFRTERFVVADTFPYSRQSFQNRARVRTPERDGQAWQWMTVPVRSSTRDGPVCAAVPAGERWAEKHRRALAYNYRTAPYYDHYAPGLLDLLGRAWPTLGALTVASVCWTHRALRAPSDLVLASTLPGAPDDLAAVLRATEPDRLVTLPESAGSDRAVAAVTGAEVEVVRYAERPRRQNFPGFEPGLSALDLLMNYGSEAARVLESDLG